jgi:hypothetical protein
MPMGPIGDRDGKTIAVGSDEPELMPSIRSIRELPGSSQLLHHLSQFEYSGSVTHEGREPSPRAHGLRRTILASPRYTLCRTLTESL